MEEQTNRSRVHSPAQVNKKVNKNVNCGIRSIIKFRALFIEILKGLVYFLHKNKRIRAIEKFQGLVL